MFKKRPDADNSFVNPLKIRDISKWGVTENSSDDQILFKLSDEKGKLHAFSCDIQCAKIIADNLSTVAQIAEEKNNNTVERITIPFETSFASAACLMNDKAEFIQFQFNTLNGLQYTTDIGPHLAYELYRSLDYAISTLPTPPELQKGGFPWSKTEGKLEESTKTDVYFGQEYPSELINMLGVWIVRMNLLENNLIGLFAQTTGLKLYAATALFYSTSNMKARLDMIKCSLPFSSLDNVLIKEVNELIEKVGKLQLTRNELIHGGWSFKKDGFTVQVLRPLSKNPLKEIYVNFNYMEELLIKYKSLSDTAGLLIERANNIKKTKLTPPS